MNHVVVGGHVCAKTGCSPQRIEMRDFHFYVKVLIIVATTIQCCEEVDGDLIAEKEGG
jgi:hypothetical protein